MLERRKGKSWSKQESSTFVKMVEKYGKNYKLIKAKIPTKTQRQVNSYGLYLYKRKEKNPKHLHSALKKKLKPKTLFNWTEK